MLVWAGISPVGVSPAATIISTHEEHGRCRRDTSFRVNQGQVCWPQGHRLGSERVASLAERLVLACPPRSSGVPSIPTALLAVVQPVAGLSQAIHMVSPFELNGYQSLETPCSSPNPPKQVLSQRGQYASRLHGLSPVALVTFKSVYGTSELPSSVRSFNGIPFLLINHFLMRSCLISKHECQMPPPLKNSVSSVTSHLHGLCGC